MFINKSHAFNTFNTRLKNKVIVMGLLDDPHGDTVSLNFQLRVFREKEGIFVYFSSLRALIHNRYASATEKTPTG